MKQEGKVRLMAEDEVELEQIKSDLKVIRLALLQEILKQAKSMDPDPNLIARLSSIYLKVSARLEKMLRGDSVPGDGDMVPSRLDNDSGDSSPNCHCEESHLEGRRSNLGSDNTDCHRPSAFAMTMEGISPSLSFSPTRGEKKGDNVTGHTGPPLPNAQCGGAATALRENSATVQNREYPSEGDNVPPDNVPIREQNSSLRA
jgi:hypothetical protein